MQLPDESPEALRERMGALQQEHAARMQKTPEEMAGDPFEATYFASKMAAAVRSGDAQSAHRWMAEMLRCAPTSGNMRLAAAMAHRELGEEAQMLAQLAFGLSVDPENWALHPWIAAALRRRGERAAADAVLENGWKVRRKVRFLLPVQKGERERYLAQIPEEPS